MLQPVFASAGGDLEGTAAPIPLGEGVTGWSVRNRRTCNAEAVVAVPLVAHDRVVGALNVHRTTTPFSPREVELVERFATMAALAYDSARQRDVLRGAAKTDGLTGLLNHRGSQERLRAEIDRARASRCSCGRCSRGSRPRRGRSARAPAVAAPPGPDLRT